jgi:putative aldouronate transport system permease protein
MAAAAGFYQSVVGFIVVLIANGVVRKVSNENALF